LLALSASPGGAQALRFEKVSDHCHVLQLPGEERNVCAIASAKGVMLVNPPPPADLARVRDALKALSAAPVLWLLHTDPIYAREDTARGLAGKGTVILSSEEQYKLAGTPGDPAATSPAPEKNQDPRKGEPGAPLTFTFGRQVTLYPDGVEVRVIAVPHRQGFCRGY
jgi:hypothetical protein